MLLNAESRVLAALSRGMTRKCGTSLAGPPQGSRFAHGPREARMQFHPESTQRLPTIHGPTPRLQKGTRISMDLGQSFADIFDRGEPGPLFIPRRHPSVSSGLRQQPAPPLDALILLCNKRGFFERIPNLSSAAVFRAQLLPIVICRFSPTSPQPLIQLQPEKEK
jgi:hypothetical protein